MNSLQNVLFFNLEMYTLNTGAEKLVYRMQAHSFYLFIFYKVNTPEQVLPSAFPVIAFSSPWHAMIFPLI